MHLIELFLPLYNNDKKPFGKAAFDQVRNELIRKFGGVTAFQRSPAEGVWKEESGNVSLDQIVIFEVMAEKLDRQWWTTYRKDLEVRFQQQQLVIRVSQFELI